MEQANDKGSGWETPERIGVARLASKATRQWLRVGGVGVIALVGLMAKSPLLPESALAEH